MGTTYRIKKSRKHKGGAKYKIISGTKYRIDKEGQVTKTTYRKIANVGDSQKG